MDCIFCKIANKEMESNFVYEDDTVMVIMDISPICDGHLLVIPKNHYDTVFDVPSEVLNHMYEVANKITHKVMDKLKEPGATIAFNYGAKQAIKHVHMHIMPNFEVKASKKVEDVYKLLMEE